MQISCKPVPAKPVPFQPLPVRITPIIVIKRGESDSLGVHFPHLRDKFGAHVSICLGYMEYI